MDSRLLKKADLKTSPWKNGGGSTAEIAISPSHARLSELNFDWRISIAEVSKAGPFSLFPGYERKLVVWQGGRLTINADIKEKFIPFEFSGDQVSEAVPIEGAVKDIGFIFRKEKAKTQILHYALKSSESAELQNSEIGYVLCASGELRVNEFYLNPGDVVCLNGEGKVQVHAFERSDLIYAQVFVANAIP